jgi:hypothetical protein
MTMRATSRLARLFAGALVATLAGVSARPSNAATVSIINMDGAGEGFNDPTVVAPVGGNPETTLGAQRLYVFQHAANIWGGILPSNVTIRVRAQFNALTCTATSGVLGSAGPVNLTRDFVGAPVAGHWYHMALANKLANSDLDPGNDDISATFNSSVGQAGCLPEGWYYGVDGNEGTKIELLPVVLHELGHGLGFSTSTSGSTGSYSSSAPHIYDRFLYDNGTGLHWDQMTAAQRVTSATACTRLAWDGPYTTANAPSFLGDKPVLRVTAPAGIAGDYTVGVPSFGAALGNPGVSGPLVLVNDGVGTVTNACEPLTNAGAVNGKIALLDRGGCAFTIKVKNAQNAGAIAAVVADSVAGCPPGDMGGADATITIPSVRITQADGNLLKANLGGGVSVTLLRDPTLLAGADAAGRVLVYTPTPFTSGSSISHWDVTANPNLLMEPALNTELSSSVDLTRWHFADIGWFQGLAAVEPPVAEAQLIGNRPNPFASSTAIRFALAREERVDLGVYDLSGRLVATLQSGRLAAGDHSIEWNGRDRDGRFASPGVYLYRLAAGTRIESRPMVLVR